MFQSLAHVITSHVSNSKQGRPVAADDFFLVFPSLLSFLLFFLQRRVSEDSSDAWCEKYGTLPSFLLFVGSVTNEDCFWSHKLLESSWNVMALGDVREGKWRGKWRMEWVASTFHTTSEHGVSSIATADAHTSAASSRLNWRPCLFNP